MNKESIQKLLSEIKYPGFSRDIISFGILKDIVIDENNIQLDLSINTNDENVINQIVQDI